MKVCVLASGSSGNSIYIQEGATRVLVDAGLTAKQIVLRLEAIGANPADLQAIVVSHEHSDHIKGVGVLARKYGLPVWMTEGTWGGCKNTFRGTERVRTFDNDQSFAVGDLGFQPYALSHDAADPVNFVVSGAGACVGIATDMGTVTQLAYERLRPADLVVIETNYDRDLLEQRLETYL